MGDLQAYSLQDQPLSGRPILFSHTKGIKYISFSYPRYRHAQFHPIRLKITRFKSRQVNNLSQLFGHKIVHVHGSSKESTTAPQTQIHNGIHIQFRDHQSYSSRHGLFQSHSVPGDLCNNRSIIKESDAVVIGAYNPRTSVESLPSWSSRTDRTVRPPDRAVLPRSKVSCMSARDSSDQRERIPYQDEIGVTL